MLTSPTNASIALPLFFKDSLGNLFELRDDDNYFSALQASLIKLINGTELALTFAEPTNSTIKVLSTLCVDMENHSQLNLLGQTNYSSNGEAVQRFILTAQHLCERALSNNGFDEHNNTLNIMGFCVFLVLFILVCWAACAASPPLNDVMVEEPLPAAQSPIPPRGEPSPVLPVRAGEPSPPSENLYDNNVAIEIHDSEMTPEPGVALQHR